MAGDAGELARDHEFTFLDHALKCGDSLVGLTRRQIGAMHWDAAKPPTFVGKLIGDKLKAAEAKREKIRTEAEAKTEAELRPLMREAETAAGEARRIADALVACHFAAEKPKARIAKLVALQKTVLAHAGRAVRHEAIEPVAASLQQGEPQQRIRPFHWELEFPEVFARADPGFDAIVGNPPFAGKNTIAAGNRAGYGQWLQTLHEGAHGNADLVAHFFRRAFTLLRPGGAFGLIATNTIGQGDTRTTGLAVLLAEGGTITRATRRLKWPGEAAVVVSVVHLVKGPARSPVLDGRQVRRISAYLVEGDLDTAPAPLAANAGKAFQGSIVLGMGFTFDDEAAAKGTASSLAEMRRLIEKDPRNAERIFPYIGGEEVNNDPRQAHHRFVIRLEEFSLLKASEKYPELIEIVRRLVRPSRERLGENPDAKRRRENWWRWGRDTPALHTAIAQKSRVIATNCGASPHLVFTFLPTGMVYAHTLAVLAFSTFAPFAVLQSRLHEVWARFFSSTLEDRLRYAPSDCFRTFPFPEGFETDAALEAAGESYHAHRAALMIARNEGLTKTYNRFHDPRETAPDIVRLRELHDAMDHAVLRAYGWDDLIARAVPQFLDEAAEDDHNYQGRHFWPADLRNEVLARLLALNADRAAEERALGLAPTGRGQVDEDEEELEEVS